MEHEVGEVRYVTLYLRDILPEDERPRIPGMRQCASCGKWKAGREFFDFRGRPRLGETRCRQCRGRALWSGAFIAQERMEEFRRTAEGRALRLFERLMMPSRGCYKGRSGTVVRLAKMAGILSAPPCCPRCGKRRPLHAHHANYALPVDVDWLCGSCHGKETGRLRKLARELSRPAKCGMCEAFETCCHRPSTNTPCQPEDGLRLAAQLTGKLREHAGPPTPQPAPLYV